MAVDFVKVIDGNSGNGHDLWVDEMIFCFKVLNTITEIVCSRGIFIVIVA